MPERYELWRNPLLVFVPRVILICGEWLTVWTLSNSATVEDEDKMAPGAVIACSGLHERPSAGLARWPINLNQLVGWSSYNILFGKLSSSDYFRILLLPCLLKYLKLLSQSFRIQLLSLLSFLWIKTIKTSLYLQIICNVFHFNDFFNGSTFLSRLSYWLN